ncbi:transposase [Peribacillus huizhouensis]|uniref:Transposase n=1 Tax=Peribacillus huizhouensis TaxID=1501239 RepID=A0ABR6CU46_9BACI|nr:transposase [Peribacillus huizhouensis]
MSRSTIYKYLQMTFEETKKLLEGPHRKPRKLASYRDWIIAWLEEYPHLSAAKIRDWLLKRYPDLVIGESTVRTYVKEMREIHITKL